MEVKMFNKIRVKVKTYPITLATIFGLFIVGAIMNLVVADLNAKNEAARLEAAERASISVKVTINDQEFNMTTRHKKVEDIISTLGFKIMEGDQVYPGLDERVGDQDEIRVILQERKSTIEYAEVQNTATREGFQFVYQKKLTDAELTAYSAGYEHTSKNPDDPLYGITFSGAYVQDGHTVAVDPKVIPLGWWMYIEGYGYRKAEDTGNAVRNKRVDIYYDDNDVARAFGLKRNVTIYVIGPEDPRTHTRVEL